MSNCKKYCVSSCVFQLPCCPDMEWSGICIPPLTSCWTGRRNESYVCNWGSMNSGWPPEIEPARACHYYVYRRQVRLFAAQEPAAPWGDEPKQERPKDEPAAIHAERHSEIPVEAPVCLAFPPTCRCCSTEAGCELIWKAANLTYIIYCLSYNVLNNFLDLLTQCGAYRARETWKGEKTQFLLLPLVPVKSNFFLKS